MRVEQRSAQVCAVVEYVTVSVLVEVRKGAIAHLKTGVTGSNIPASRGFGFFFLTRRRPPTSTLLPYTTLVRAGDIFAGIVELRVHKGGTGGGGTYSREQNSFAFRRGGE